MDNPAFPVRDGGIRSGKLQVMHDAVQLRNRLFHAEHPHAPEAGKTDTTLPGNRIPVEMQSGTAVLHAAATDDIQTVFPHQNQPPYLLDE